MYNRFRGNPIHSLALLVLALSVVLGITSLYPIAMREEENNVIRISTESWKRIIDLEIKVPFKTSLKLSCVNSGDIVVENVEGEFLLLKQVLLDLIHHLYDELGSLAILE